MLANLWIYVVLATRIIDLAVSEAKVGKIRGNSNASKAKKFKKYSLRKLKNSVASYGGMNMKKIKTRKLEEEEEECTGLPPGQSLEAMNENGNLEEVHKFSLNYCHCVSGCTPLNKDEREEIRSCYWNMLENAEEGGDDEEAAEEPAADAEGEGGEEEEAEEIDEDTQALMDEMPFYWHLASATRRFNEAMEAKNTNKACDVLKCSAFCMEFAACGQGSCAEAVSCAKSRVKAECEDNKAAASCDANCDGASAMSPHLVLIILPLAALSKLWL